MQEHFDKGQAERDRLKNEGKISPGPPPLQTAVVGGLGFDTQDIGPLGNVINAPYRTRPVSQAAVLKELEAIAEEKAADADADKLDLTDYEPEEVLDYEEDLADEPVELEEHKDDDMDTI